ncbi:MAG TPA: glycogen-binding domain-containing protein [Gemmatimonadales bacterium]|nr:glycogen-binding domain-containing protein [Gemmatimonadales bacterium]
MAATRLALAIALAPLGAARATIAAAQIVVSLDAGASHVEYDGFLPSAAFSLTPALRVVRERVAFGARATWLRFESGNSSLQGLLAGSVVLASSRRSLAELGAELGGSRYEHFARFSHVLASARLQFLGTQDRAGSLALTLGAVEKDGETRPIQRASGAVRFAREALSVTLTGTGTIVGGSDYADFSATFRHTHRSGLEAEASVSARAGDAATDAGPYVEAALTVPLLTTTALVLAGGRYPTDAVRGNIGGRFVTAAVRISTPRRPRPIPRAALPPATAAPGDGSTVAATLVETRRGRGESCTLVVHAAGASSVELMGDFTDWSAVTLQPAGNNTWSVTLRIAPGRRRINVRVNGGPWSVPAGTTAVADDFQGMVGAIVIP